jgi:hypothetical protein
MPLLSLGFFTGLIEVRNRLSKVAPRRRSIAGTAFVTAVVFGIFSMQLVALGRGYAKSGKVSYKTQSGQLREYRLFFYMPEWQVHDAALNWLAERADSDEIVATSTPHWLFLKTGLRSVMPPFEADAGEAQRLLDSVPVSYLIVDQLEFVDISRRYAARIVKKFPERWELIYSSAERGSRIYRRVTSEESKGSW